MEQQPVIWHGDAHEANKLYGDRYGVDWVYPKDVVKKPAKQPWDIRNEELSKKAQEVFLLLHGCSFNEANRVWNQVVSLYHNTPIATLPQVPTAKE